MNDIKLVCFDLNKTLIKENTWLDLNLALGITPEEDGILMKWYEEGIISYDEGQKIICDLYIKRGKATLQNILSVISKYTFLPNAQEIVKYLKEKGYEIALISGSIDILVEKIAHELDIKMFAANNLFIFNESDYLENIVSLGDDKLAKLRHLRSFARQMGISIEQCTCIGDGDNDIEMFNKSKHGITFNESKIKSSSWKLISSLDDIRLIL